MGNHKTEYVSVRFAYTSGLYHPSGSSYTYFSHIHDFKIGDLVVVNVGFPRPDNLDLKVATITDIDPPPEARAKASKWIVDRIDLDVYRAVSKLIEEPKNVWQWVAYDSSTVRI